MTIKHLRSNIPSIPVPYQSLSPAPPAAAAQAATAAAEEQQRRAEGRDPHPVTRGAQASAEL